MHKPKKRDTFYYKKKSLKEKIYYIEEMDQKILQNKIDNLHEQQHAKLAKYISKLEKEKQIRKAIKIKEKQEKSPQPPITKIVSSTTKSL